MHKLFLSMLFILLISTSSYAEEKLIKVYTKPEQCFQKHITNSPSFKKLQTWDNNTHENIDGFYGVYLDYLNCLSENKLLNASFNCYSNKLTEHEKAICYLENHGSYFNDNVQVTVIADMVSYNNIFQGF